MEPITIEALIKAPVEKVWEYLNKPEHITHWAFASDDWQAPSAENDLTVGGKLKVRMEAKDGSSGFDMVGVYTAVEQNKLIEYKMGDRNVKIEFMPVAEGTKVTQTFDPENENPREMQKAGWQAILDNFKKYVESSRD
ncbi:MAG: SRPBCC family protein [Candidatus Doudnabacteria bacterium]|nr:SRPBCC family protein [Candidatus Doudnabacteria bacterium]